VLLISSNINEICDNNIHANINEICDKKIHVAFSTFYFSCLGCILVATFLLLCYPIYQILSQLWAKPPPSLSFALGVIEAFKTKLDLEASDFEEVDDVDKSSSGCWRPQEWIPQVGLQSRKTINKSAQSMCSQE
jgi:hypothetical protein